MNTELLLFLPTFSVETLPSRGHSDRKKTFNKKKKTQNITLKFLP